MKNLITTLTIVGIIPVVLLAHGDNKHANTAKAPVIKEKSYKDTSPQDRYKTINIEYIKKIKPIFEKKCFDCHGTIKKYPWYYAIVGISQMIDYDIKEAKKHIDMSTNFPFISHESPLQDLKSLKEIAIENDMPPFRYLLLHWDAKLTDKEKQLLIQWSDASIRKLKGVRYE